MTTPKTNAKNRDVRRSRQRRGSLPGGRLALSPEMELARLKDKLLDERLTEYDEPRLARLARLAATEAEALSWLTPFPLLVLPVLLEEKLDAVQRYARGQRQLLRQ